METENQNNDILKAADRRKQITQLYSGSDIELRRVFNKTTQFGGSGIYTEAYLDSILTQVGLPSLNVENVKKISHYGYATDPNYTSVIDYYSKMFMWRYYYFPVKVKEKASEGDYADMYALMTEIIDGLALETTMPELLTTLFLEGSIYLYTSKTTTSKTISTTLLNSHYCKPVSVSQYGTGVYQFDLKYFDDLGFTAVQLIDALQYFPKELSSAYAAWKGGGEQKIILDGRYSTYVNLNDFRFPNKLNVLKSLFDYKKYRANEVERSSSQLDRIITHKIPSFQNQLLFEVPEVKALHTSMSKITSKDPRTKLMTTFGETQILPMLSESSVQSQALEQGHEAIFRTAGLNPTLFTGITKEALDISLVRDKSAVWAIVDKLMSFYNIAINNLYNFKGYQAQLNMLPITHFDEKEKMELYRGNAEYGIGRLEAIVASGTKQRDITYKAELEDFLKLDEILKPLASSHTQSGDETPEEQPEEEETPEENPEGGSEE